MASRANRKHNSLVHNAQQQVPEGTVIINIIAIPGINYLDVTTSSKDIDELNGILTSARFLVNGGDPEQQQGISNGGIILPT